MVRFILGKVRWIWGKTVYHANDNKNKNTRETNKDRPRPSLRDSQEVIQE